MKPDTTRVDALQLIMGAILICFSYLLYAQGSSIAVVLFGVGGMVFLINIVMNRFAFRSYLQYGLITMLLCLLGDVLSYLLLPFEINWQAAALILVANGVTALSGVLFHLLHRETLY